jgi:perosamine synthetase
VKESSKQKVPPATPPVRIPHNRPTLGVEEKSAAERVLASGWVAQGKEVEAFEEELSRFLGLSENKAVALSSGSAALFLALKAIGVEKQVVAMPAYSCSALRHAARLAGAECRFLDCESSGPNLDVGAAARAGARAIIAPHMFGLPMNLKKLSERAAVVEDCAQALGARLEGAPVGLAGKIGVFSFYATKLLTSGGQGGMLVTQDASLLAWVRDYRAFDCRRDELDRFNFQMTDLQAAVGRAQLQKLPAFLERRREIFELYRKAGLPLLDNFPNGAVPARFRCVIKCRNPGTVQEVLRENGIQSIIPVEDWELLSRDEAPKAVALSRSTLSLPCYPSLRDDEVDLIVKLALKTLEHL